MGYRGLEWGLPPAAVRKRTQGIGGGLLSRRMKSTLGSHATPGWVKMSSRVGKQLVFYLDYTSTGACCDNGGSGANVKSVV
jgi:hypothetical protein